jgi:hypothetical protein
MGSSISKLRAAGYTALVTGVAAASFVLVPAAQAAAYDGSSPFSTGCSNSGGIVSSTSVYYPDGSYAGWVALWYSTGCRTTWAETYSVDGYNVYAEVIRNSDGARYISPAGYYQEYSPQLNDAGVTSYAYGYIYGAGGARTGSY